MTDATTQPTQLLGSLSLIHKNKKHHYNFPMINLMQFHKSNRVGWFLFFPSIISLAQPVHEFYPSISPAQLHQAEQGGSRPGHPNSVIAPPMSPIRLHRLERSALAGSPDAANTLSIYYIDTVSNPEKRDYWRIIAAENGSTISQYNYGVHLTLSSDAILVERGIFWLEKSRSNGFEPADKTLFDISHPNISAEVPSLQQKHLIKNKANDVSMSNNHATSIYLAGANTLTFVSLSDQEVNSELPSAARSGSWTAAQLLSQHYAQGGNYDQLGVWLRMWAQNGDPLGEYNYGRYLKCASAPENNQRSSFLIRKSNIRKPPKATLLDAETCRAVRHLTPPAETAPSLRP